MGTSCKRLRLTLDPPIRVYSVRRPGSHASPASVMRLTLGSRLGLILWALCLGPGLLAQSDRGPITGALSVANLRVGIGTV